MKRQTVGLVLVGVAAAGVLYWYWKRQQQPTTGAATLVPTVVSVGPFDFVTGFSWGVAPAQPATPNTPTVDPVWARRNPGVVPV